MQNVVLIVHLLLALSLIGVVLMQRSEGGGLGMGGGNAMSGRGAATALGKVTWALAIAFIATSLTLTIFAAENATGTSVLDRLGEEADVEAPAEEGGPVLPDAEGLLPPPQEDADAPLVPRAE